MFNFIRQVLFGKKMSTDEILDSLSKLDLKTFPEREAHYLISRIGQIGSVMVTLKPGKTMMRLCQNKNGERFTTAKRISYKPQEINETYQRASTPRNTMFYASFNSDIEEKEKKIPPQITCALETYKWMREDDTINVQTVTYGRWVVTKPINLIAVVHHKDFYDRNPYTAELVDSFKRDLEKDILREKTLKVLDFFAKQYANDQADPDHSYLYILSAMFSEMCIKRRDIHGVIYPSVRAEGRSLNLAMIPKAAEKCLELYAAGEATIYKYLKNADIDYETITKVPSGQKTFKPLHAGQYHRGTEEILNSLGLSTTDDFRKHCEEYLKQFNGFN